MTFAPSGTPPTHTEDAMAFVLRSGASRGTAGIDPDKPHVLEVAEVWGDVVMDVQHFGRGGRPVTIGASTDARRRSTFFAPTDEDQPLCTWSAGGWVFRFRDTWEGFVDLGQERVAFADLVASGRALPSAPGAHEIPVSEGTRIVAQVGPVLFFAQLVRPGRKVVARFEDRVDFPFLGTVMSAIFLFSLLALFVAVAPPPATSGFVEMPDRFAEIFVQTQVPDVPRAEVAPREDEGARAKEAEGRVGKRDAKMKLAEGTKTEMRQRELDREIAENAGIIGIMNDSSSLDGVFSTSTLSAGITGGIGGLIGTKGDQWGAHGLGSRGSAFGGGGSADTIGGMGIEGRSSGSRNWGENGGELTRKQERPVTLGGGGTIVLGALDRAQVDAVIKRHTNQIRYCYQRELTRTPGLAGKVTVRFVIGRDGTVSKSEIMRSSMGDAAVEKCVTDRIMHLRFPEPRGNGVVIVSYPFMFSAG